MGRLLRTQLTAVVRGGRETEPIEAFGWSLLAGGLCAGGC